jgi:hypothetical protein
LIAQNLLSAKFGIEGSPTLLLIAGSEEEVLRPAENLTAGLESYRQNGALKSISLYSADYPPKRRRGSAPHRWHPSTSMPRPVPSKKRSAKMVCAQSLTGLTLSNCANWENTQTPVTLESAAPFLPAGLLDNSLRKTPGGNYVAAIAFYYHRP